MPFTRPRRSTRVITRLARTGLAILLLALATAQPATAHVQSTTGYSQVSSADGLVRYELSLEYEYLARAVGLEGDIADDGLLGDDTADDGVRADVLAAATGTIESYLDQRVRVFLDHVGCDAALVHTAVDRRQDVPYANLLLTYDCHGSPAGSYRIEYSVFRDADGVVDDHTNIIDYQLSDASGREVLDAGNRQLVTGEQSALTSFARFVRLGFEHILAGLDHVLFVVALLLGATTTRSVASVASTFTVAHSVTLGLAALGWVHVPADVVEPLIALSIAYVAVANLLGGPSRHRLAAVFGFGLLHGLGFAGALHFDNELSWGMVRSLVGFNAGIEAGQLLLVAMLFPALIGIRRFRWSATAHAVAAAGVAVAGLVWFLQRIPFT